MAHEQRRGGTIYLKVNGEIYDAKGSFSYNLGVGKREGIVGHDTVHGFKELPQMPFIEGEITDRSTLDLKALVAMEGVTVTLELANGKVIVLRDGWYAGEGTAHTEEGNVDFRFEGLSCDEVR